MMMQTVTERKRNLVVAGVLALISQGALSSEVVPASQGIEIVRVTAQRPPITGSDSQIEIRAVEMIEAMNRQVEKDLESTLDAIRPTRIELVISEVPTRG